LVSSSLGANIRAATKSSPVREINRAMIPPVRDLRMEYGVTMAYESSSVCKVAVSGLRLNRCVQKNRSRLGLWQGSWPPFVSSNQILVLALRQCETKCKHPARGAFSRESTNTGEIVRSTSAKKSAITVAAIETSLE
jgi:hypothetical protein